MILALEPDLHPLHRNTMSPAAAPTLARQTRRRQRLKQLEERSELVTTASETFAQYYAPRDFRANPTSGLIKEKVYLPVRGFNGLKFIGQILDPCGHRLQQVCDESKANIAIRGKGSAKEGRGRTRTDTTDDLQEPLYCLTTADEQ